MKTDPIQPKLTSFEVPKCRKEVLVAAVAGAILIVLGIVLRFYPGIGNSPMAAMLVGGALFICIAIYLAKRPTVSTKLALSAHAEPSKVNKTTKVEPPPKKADGLPPHEQLSIAIAVSDPEKVEELISKHKSSCPTLFTAKFETHNAWEKALNVFVDSDESEYFKTAEIVKLLHAHGPFEFNKPKGFTPFLLICRKICGREEVLIPESEKELLILLKPKDLLAEITQLKKIVCDDQKKSMRANELLPYLMRHVFKKKS